MLKLIFRGLLEWLYGLLMEMWEFIVQSLLDLMSMDFEYLQTHVPVIKQLSVILLVTGWALLIGNLVFQALKSMIAGLGFEGEDPKLLFSRTFVFSFLLLASPQICRIGLDLTSTIIKMLGVADATDVKLVDESVFGAMSAAWLMSAICSSIIMFTVLGLILELAERYVVLGVLMITAPLAFAMGGSKSTAPIFTGWCRMFGSMCLLVVTNLICFKMLFSVLSTVPSGLDIVPWMVLMLAIVKVAKRSDAIITRIGLNPALTGAREKSLLSTVTNSVIHTVVSQTLKGLGGIAGGGASALFSTAGAKTGGFFNGARFAGTQVGGGRYSSPSSGGSYQSSRQQNTSSQSGPQSSTAQQSSTSHTSTQQSTSGGASSAGSQNIRGGGRYSQTQGGSTTSGTPASGGASSAGSWGTRGGGRYSQTQNSPAASSTPTSGDTASVRNQGARGGGRYSQTRGSSTTSGTPASGTFSAGGQNVRGGGRYSQTRRSSVPPGTQRSPSYVSPTNSAARPQAAPNVQTRLGQSEPPSSAGSKSDQANGQAQQPAQPGRTGAASTRTASPHSSIPRSTPAGKPARSTQRPAEPAPRLSRNTPPATGAPPMGSTSSGTVQQERASSHSRTTTERTTASPAPQKQGKAVTPATPTVKGGAPTVRPGGAGTAPTGKRAASTKRPAMQPSKRAKDIRRPAARGRRGDSHG